MPMEWGIYANDVKLLFSLIIQFYADDVKHVLSLIIQFHVDDEMNVFSFIMQFYAGDSTFDSLFHCLAMDCIYCKMRVFLPNSEMFLGHEFFSDD